MKLTPVTLPPRPVEAGDEAIPDRVAPGRKDDRHRRGCGLGRERRRGIADDQGYLPAKKVRHQKPATCQFDPRPSGTRSRRSGPRRSLLPSGSGGIHADECGHRVRRLVSRNPITGIAGCCARAASGHAASCAPASPAMNSRRSHSITSSALASSVVGTVRPSILAVWALMTSSNLDACTTGRSAGLAPLRIRPA